jgi:hypothetical protein
MDESAVDGFRVVPCNRRVRGVRAGDPVMLIPVEAIQADVRLLRLPTVQRVARAGHRGVVLVPVAEWRAHSSAAPTTT